jgi:hypothetical protein
VASSHPFAGKPVLPACGKLMMPQPCVTSVHRNASPPPWMLLHPGILLTVSIALNAVEKFQKQRSRSLLCMNIRQRCNSIPAVPPLITECLRAGGTSSRPGPQKNLNLGTFRQNSDALWLSRLQHHPRNACSALSKNRCKTPFIPSARQRWKRG